MNAIASAVFVIAGAGVLAAGLLWLMRSPIFPIRSIQLDGDLARNSVPTIRANAAPRLAGNFFSVDLQAGREAFEAVPWVRRAVVRRVWPTGWRCAWRNTARSRCGRASPPIRAATASSTLRRGLRGQCRRCRDERLPSLAAPTAARPRCWLVPARAAGLRAAGAATRAAAAVGPRIVARRARQRRRGRTRRGSEDELVARTERFVRTLTQVTARWQAPLEYADLRHADGYAVRLRGVGTTPPPAGGKAPRAAKTN